MNRGKLLRRKVKPFKGFSPLRELKFTKLCMIIILIIPDKKGELIQIVGICLRRELGKLVSACIQKYGE